MSHPACSVRAPSQQSQEAATRCQRQLVRVVAALARERPHRHPVALAEHADEPSGPADLDLRQEVPPVRTAEFGEGPRSECREPAGAVACTLPSAISSRSACRGSNAPFQSSGATLDTDLRPHPGVAHAGRAGPGTARNWVAVRTRSAYVRPHG